MTELPGSAPCRPDRSGAPSGLRRRYRQFTQCDIDIVGDDSIVAEVDPVSTTLKAFAALGMANDVSVLINDRRIPMDRSPATWRSMRGTKP